MSLAAMRVADDEEIKEGVKPYVSLNANKSVVGLCAHSSSKGDFRSPDT